MIVEKIYDTNLYGDKGEWKVTQYYGLDALKAPERGSLGGRKEFIKKYLGKDIVTYNDERGVVIGLEINEAYLDDYLIVYFPSTGKIGYELGVKLIEND